MKKLFLLTLLSLLATLALRADPLITVSDNNPADVYLNSLLNPSYSGQFDLRPAYNPATMSIVDAFAEFTFWDSILLGGSETGRIRWDLAGPDQNFGGNFSVSGFFTLSGDVTGNAFLQLNANGYLDYTVTLTRGDAWLTNANLTAHAAVPERSTTAIMVGLGLMAVSFVFHRCQLTPVRV